LFGEKALFNDFSYKKKEKAQRSPARFHKTQTIGVFVVIFVNFLTTNLNCVDCSA